MWGGSAGPVQVREGMCSTNRVTKRRILVGANTKRLKEVEYNMSKEANRRIPW